jgi:hypothetical protein
MAMRVLNSHANVLNDNSAVEVSVYILLLANEEKTHTHAFRETDEQRHVSMCECVQKSLNVCN